MEYLTAEEILILHALIIDETGGSHGMRDVGLLASIAKKPGLSFNGKELYEGVFTKAAVLLEAIANYHVFTGGNKRTALITTARFLAMNGYDCTASNEDVEKTMVSVATKEIDVSEIAIWLEKNCRSI